MNENELQERQKKNQTLVIVEGNHEKYILFKLLLESFHEVPIKSDNIHVYAADIYDLYHDIEKEYEKDWYNNGSDIDIPMLISRRLKIEPQLDRRNFTNVIMIFDYEHHDTSYSDEKIMCMQKHFNNVSEDGILYINYPMVEAYKHIESIPDEGFLERFVSVKCQPGREYKNMVEATSAISKYFSVYERLLKYLQEKIPEIRGIELDKLLMDICSLYQRDTIKENVLELLLVYVPEEKMRINMAYSISVELEKLDFFEENINYWQKLRYIFMYIIDISIKKTIKLYGFNESVDNIKEKFAEIDWSKILEVQNDASRDDETGIIWVLNTAITFLSEYKFYWNKKLKR